MNNSIKHLLKDVYQDYELGEYSQNVSVLEVYHKLVSAKFRLIHQAQMIDQDLKKLDKLLYKDLLNDDKH